MSAARVRWLLLVSLGALAAVACRDRARSPDATAVDVPSGMAAIPGGTFQMGSGERAMRDEQAPHAVTVAPFLLDTLEVTTTEFIDGQPRKVLAKFRAYASHEEAFRDYARLIKDSPRYAKVVEQGGSAQGFAVNLQRAGYATDPEYAAKLGRVINTTLRLQRTLTA